jgi:hypothetical protein
MTADYIVDRLEEEGWVVLEDDKGRTFQVLRKWLPTLLREGDVVRGTSVAGERQATLTFSIDTEARERREEEIAALRGRLPRGPSGDLQL